MFAMFQVFCYKNGAAYIQSLTPLQNYKKFCATSVVNY